MLKPLDRRKFFKGCLSATAAVMSNPSLLVQADNQFKAYSKVKLIDNNNQPVTSQSIQKKQCYVFNYPFVSTPCFLINLGEAVTQPQQLHTEEGEPYSWQGGVGPQNSIVAFAAICAHKLSYPAKSISFINYRPEQIVTSKQDSSKSSQQVIFCCSERSMYDPSKGAEVIAGPAPQPLTTIMLEYDADSDNYYAIGTLGSELYESFFERFGFNLALENSIEDVTKPVKKTAIIYRQSEYSKQQQSC